MHVLASWQDLAAQQKYTQILSKNPTKIFRFITASNKTCRFCWCLPKKVFAALRSWAPRLSANHDIPSPFSWQIQFLLGCYFKDEVSFIKYLHVVYNKFPVWHPALSILNLRIHLPWFKCCPGASGLRIGSPPGPVPRKHEKENSKNIDPGTNHQNNLLGQS